ncbi:vWA domain-containing protein [Sporosalibacterium faouarense]|uniref:vWA domain-containing protein n=1 Tax=Sporosalibacterium faouarense TaxID=516123 RepID=UPI00141C6DE1|nr:VWA domain-containing protein [Sporosalibacterium faouarense]MTI46495.1 VWA domain-containing protein [Bacillota bacterium]
MEKEIELKQIILATDGESNVGADPIDVAKDIHNKGITISTIGIIDNNKSEKPLAEVHSIAEVGGGISEITNIENFSRTMEMVTQKSVYKTIEHAVNKELKEILGTELKDTPPQTRNQITELIDKYGEEVDLKCCVAIDCSGSMTNKINIAKNSVLNLLKVLKARKGRAEIAVIGYPGSNKIKPTILCPFTEKIEDLERGLQKIKTGGITPTGDALEWASRLLMEGNWEEDRIDSVTSEDNRDTEEGILESNII